MKNSYFLVTLLSFTIFSCKEELKPQESYVDYSAKMNTANQGNATTSGINNSQQATASTSKVNPPHGQPGHVCGTEMQQQNTPTQLQTNTNQQYTVSQPTATSKAMVQNAVKVGKGMNPAHGQAGHRCDIAVGAPLNSKPAAVPINKSSQVTTQTNTSSNGSFSITPAQNNTPALLTPNNSQPEPTSAATNPPHGQPGHVCNTPTNTTSEVVKEAKKE